MGSAVEQGPFVSWHAGAVVGVEEDDRVFRQSVFVQLPQDFADLLVHRGDTVIEACHGFPDHGRVWIIGRQGGLGRIVYLVRGQAALHFSLKLLVGPHHRAALVGGHQVEHAEEGFPGRAFAEVRGVGAVVP